MNITQNTFITENEFANLMRQTSIDYKANSTIAVAVSGGVDSIALVLLLQGWCATKGVNLVALTVDHGLRPESVNEAEFVQKFMHEKGIEHHILKINWPHEKPTKAVQEKARSERYENLLSWCYDRHISCLFLGHHLNDQAETYLIRLRNNSSIIGLAGMRLVTNRQRCIIVRPLLPIEKDKIVATANNLKATWVDDPSNKNPNFERVFWRNFIEGESINSTFLAMLDSVRNAYEGWIARYLEKYSYQSDLGYIKLEKSKFDLLPQNFKDILLSYILRAYGTKDYPPKSATVKLICSALSANDFSAKTAHGLRIAKSGGFYVFTREHKAITEEVDLESIKNGNFIWDNRFIVKVDKQTNGVIKRVGEDGWVQLLAHNPELKKLDEPRYALWSLPALWINNEIIPRENKKSGDFSYDFVSKFPFYTLPLNP